MDDNISAFLSLLDPADNSTGGGTASAVAGSMAAALVAMVGRLSVGKYLPPLQLPYDDLIAEAEALTRALFDGGREDSQAFAAIRASYQLSKATVEQQASRRASIQRAILHATQVPLTNAGRCQRVLELGVQLVGHSNPNAASDLECAGHLARAGLLGCVANVRINMCEIKDAAVAGALAQQTQALTAWLAAFDAPK